jgi:hypothetical protein
MNERTMTQIQGRETPMFTSVQGGVLQRKCACGLHTVAGGECEECRQKREEMLQRSAVSTAPMNNVLSIVHKVLSSPGQPLDGGTRAFMEPRFGHDFSQVKVHSGERAAESARAVNALAYTVERDVVFGAGQYRPETMEGKRLLAHELTHVVQQGNRVMTGKSNELIVGREGDIFEQEANRVSERVVLGQPSSTTQSSQLMLHRQSLISPPPAAQVTDTRVSVLPTDRSSLDELRRFLEDITGQIRGLVGRNPPSEPWMTSSNPNVQALLSHLDSLVHDLQAGRLIVRFDQALTGEQAASYEFLSDTMHLRRFSGQAERNKVAIDLVHEYAHALQDRTVENMLSTAITRVEHTREDELGQEIEARRSETYFTRLLRALRMGISADINEAFQAEITARVFVSNFERERTGSRAERAAATRGIRSDIETAYTEQLQENAPIGMYRIEIDNSNQALLFARTTAGASPINLGSVPATVQNREALISNLATKIQVLSTFANLFVGSRQSRYNKVVFAVFYRNQRLAEFGLERP